MDYRQEYDKWCNDPYFDDQTREELKAIAGDDKEIDQRIRKLYQNICQKTQPECNGRCQRRRRGIQISVWYPQCDVRSRGIPRTDA